MVAGDVFLMSSAYATTSSSYNDMFNKEEPDMPQHLSRKSAGGLDLGHWRSIIDMAANETPIKKSNSDNKSCFFGFKQDGSGKE